MRLRNASTPLLTFRDLARIAKNTAFGFPGVAKRYEQRELERGYDSSKDVAAYPRSVFAEHYAALTAVGFDVKGASVLEIGPGGNLGVPLLFLNEGAEAAAAVDLTPWLEDHPSLYRDLVGERGGSLASQIDYRSGNVTMMPFADESFDLVFSHASFEHFADPATAIAEIARVLRPGGYTSHRIDLRDHTNFARPLAFLAYSDRVWSAMTSNVPWKTNRWRRAEFINAFKGRGLQVLSAEPTAIVPAEELASAMLSPRFQHLGEDVAVVGVMLVARKPLRSA